MDAATFKRYRESLGMGLPDLAEALGVAHATVWRWEHGKKEIGNPVMVELALRCLLYERRAGIDRALGVTPAQEVREAFEANWEDSEPAMRYLSGVEPKELLRDD